MISLSEDEWALCEEHQEYMADKKVPPLDLQERYMEVMTKMYVDLISRYDSRKGHDCEEDEHHITPI